MSKPTAIYLCSGAGISEGLGGNPFDIALAVEQDHNAARAFALNRSQTEVWTADIAQADILEQASRRFDGVDAILASPPCPAFSRAGDKWAPYADDKKAYLATLDWVAQMRPRWFVCENVATIKESAYLRYALHRLSRLGYQVQTWELDAASFGTPQYRVRNFLIANRQGTRSPEQPRPTHGSDIRPLVTVADALGPLEADQKSDCPSYSYLREWVLRAIPPGCDARWLEKTADRFKENRRRLEYIEFSGKGRFGRLDPHAPSPTLPTKPLGPRAKSHPGSLQRSATLRFDRNGSVLAGVRGQYAELVTRPLSIKESLALMGAPHRWNLVGPMTQKYRQVGNGIPPQLWEVVLAAVVGR